MQHPGHTELAVLLWSFQLSFPPKETRYTCPPPHLAQLPPFHPNFQFCLEPRNPMGGGLEGRWPPEACRVNPEMGGRPGEGGQWEGGQAPWTRGLQVWGLFVAPSQLGG